MPGRNRDRVLVLQRAWLAVSLVLTASLVAQANSVTIANHDHNAGSARLGIMGPLSVPGSELSFIGGRVGAEPLPLTAGIFVGGSESLPGMSLPVDTPGGNIFYNGGFRKSYLKNTVDVATIVTPTPEPGSLVLMGTGLLGLAFVTRRRLIARQGKN